MRMYRGCDLLLITEILADDDRNFIASEPRHYVGLTSVTVPSVTETRTVYKDGKAIKNFNIDDNKELKINVGALTEDTLSYFLGKSESENLGYAIDTGTTNKKYFALGFRTSYTDGSDRYTWYLKGTFREQDRTIETMRGDTTCSGTELIYTPVLTNYKFEINKKPCRSVTVESSNIDRDINSRLWANVVWTPDNIVGSNAPVVYPNNVNLLIGDTITISSAEGNDIEYEIIKG